MQNEILELEAIEVNPELSVVVKQSGLQKGDEHAFVFAPFMKTVAELSEKLPTLNKENPSALDAKIARECRLALVKNRTATAAQKDASKSTLLAESNLIQSLHNVIANKSKLIEADYEAIEKHAEIKEAARKEALKAERMELLKEFEMDLTGYDLGAMADKTFDDLLESQKALAAHRIAEAKRLEEERIAAEKKQAEEQEAICIENERLKAEAEKREKEIAAEKKKQEAARKKLEEENAKKIAAIEAANKAAREKAAKEAEAIAQKAAEEKKAAELAAIEERKKAEALEAQVQAAKDAEAKRLAVIAKEEADKKAAAAKAAKAPDKVKLQAWVKSAEMPAPDVKDAESQAVMNAIVEKFNGFKAWAAKQIEAL